MVAASAAVKDLPKGRSFTENDGALKKEDLDLEPVSITRIGEVQQGKFGTFVIAQFSFLSPKPGQRTDGDVYIEGRMLGLFQAYFLNNPRGSLEGIFAKNVILPSGDKLRGWQFLDPDAELTVNEDGWYIWNNWGPAKSA